MKHHAHCMVLRQQCEKWPTATHKWEGPGLTGMKQIRDIKVSLKIKMEKYSRL